MSSLAQDLPLDLNLGNTFGALFIGVILGAVLFGVTNVQAFIYFQTHDDTGMAVYKWIVIWLWILDALHLALVIHCVYHYLVNSYADISALTEIVWSFKLQVIIDVFVIYGVLILYTYRIWIVSKGRSRVLPATVGIIVVLGSGDAIALIWAIYQCHTFTDLVGIEWSTYMSLSTITFVDVVIASSLCYILATSRAGLSSADSFLTKLMVYIINTGCLTSIFSIGSLITTAVMPRNFVSFGGIGFLIAKLYVSSYIALLNAPYYMQPKGSETVNISEFRAHRPTLHSTSESDNPQETRKDGSRHLYDHDDQLHPTRPFHAVMPKQPIQVAVITERSISSSVTDWYAWTVISS
ncbi:hypothetical protein M405DRAFT_826892 [Rhizopogon salebrosus TDB-379]|nr:hypothetical protein M405DRAFT_826892 [Rhizopogon salebrosus TDB-379]